MTRADTPKPHPGSAKQTEHLKALERLPGLAIGRSKYGEKADRLVPFFLKTDELADEVVAVTAGLTRERAQQLVDQSLSNTAEPGSVFAALSQHNNHVPFWVDRARCDRGGAVIIRAGLLSGVALMGSLAKSYCSSGGNKPLIVSGALINQTGERLARTAEFIRVLCQKGALLPGAPGLRAVVQVRLAHAHVRRACLRSGTWPTERWGHPINQADMAATILLFSEQLVRNIRAVGGVVSESEESDVLHLWRYIGYLIGVDAQLLCAEIAESHTLADLITCIDAGPDEDSRKLIKALFTPPPDVELPVPRPVAEAALALYQAVCRQFLGAAFADAVQLPNHGLAPVLFASRVGIRAGMNAVNVLPLGRLIQSSLGESYWSKLATGPAKS